MMEQVNIRKAQLTQRLLARKTEEADLTSVLESYQKELDAVNASIAELKKNAAGMDEQNREWKRKSWKPIRSWRARLHSTISSSPVWSLFEKYCGAL